MYNVPTQQQWLPRRWNSEQMYSRTGLLQRLPLVHNKSTTFRHVHKLYYHTHTHPFNGPLSGTTQVSWYQKGKTNLDFAEARDSEWQWHQLGHMQVCTSLQTYDHASIPTNSVKALKASCTTNPQQIEVMEPGPNQTRRISKVVVHQQPRLPRSDRIGNDIRRISSVHRATIKRA